MILRLPLGSVRRFAVLLLLLGVMFGGAVDAVACEPAFKTTAVAALEHEQRAPQESPDDQRHGDCVGNHCHHGAPTIPLLAEQSELPIMQGGHLVSGDSPLDSITADFPERPPRA